MQLISWQFILFFLLTIALLFSRLKCKKVILLVLNIIFYAFAGIVAMAILLLFAFITFFGAKVIQLGKKKKLLFISFLIVSLSPLFIYKYVEFLLNAVVPMLSIQMNLVAPLGISFFTFQGVGYLIDVYTGKCESENNFLNYITFLSLFTCISSGPINRSQSLLEQIRKYDEVEFDYAKTIDGLRYTLLGLFMKVFISACMGVVSPSASSGMALLVGSICFTIQIYCDFCGYSYIAYGLSKIIGIEVIQNFDKPYTSKSLTEFWRRWHISLSMWFRDYVYIPLGGSRCAKWRAYLNLLIVFAISGLWHGANWTFLVWGLLNGLFLVVEKITGAYKISNKKWVNVIKQIFTLILINTLWIFFNATSLQSAVRTIITILTKTVFEISALFSISGILSFVTALGISMKNFLILLCAGGAFILIEVLTINNEPIYILKSKYKWLAYVKCAIMILTILILGATVSTGGFIYANF